MNEVKFRPRMRFFHSNSKGTGCALSLELVPAIGNDEGCIMATFANQASVGNLQGATPIYPKFDWERALIVKLGFEDICKMLQVFRGECESVGDGKGLFHGKANAYAVITLRHILEPSSGYMLGVRRLYADGKEARAILTPRFSLLLLSLSLATTSLLLLTHSRHRFPRRVLALSIGI